MKSRKELKEAYKHKKAVIGIFHKRNKSNGKVLIEQSLDIPAKWNRIRTELKFGSHRNKALQEDWNKSNEDNFEFSILSKLDIKDGDDSNLDEDLKVLKEMTLEELHIDDALCY